MAPISTRRCRPPGCFRWGRLRPWRWRPSATAGLGRALLALLALLVRAGPAPAGPVPGPAAGSAAAGVAPGGGRRALPGRAAGAGTTQFIILNKGPDYPAEGLGYADTATGRVVLVPRYEAAFPFASGRARVGRRCRLRTDGNHSWGNCAEWAYINHRGQPWADTTQ